MSRALHQLFLLLLSVLVCSASASKLAHEGNRVLISELSSKFVKMFLSRFESISILRLADNMDMIDLKCKDIIVSLLPSEEEVDRSFEGSIIFKELSFT